MIGVYAYRPNPVQGSFAVTAVLSPLFCAWLVAAVEREVGPSAGAILTVAAGGAERAWRGRLALIAIVSAAVTVVFLVWPTATGAFDRNPGAGDLIAAGVAHLACGAFGGALALVVAAPVRTATAFAAVLMTIIGSIALAHPLGAIAGPGAVARALDASPVDAVSGRLAAACVVTLAEAAALAYGARRLARWRG